MRFFVLANLDEAFASKVRKPSIGEVLFVKFAECLAVEGVFEMFEGESVLEDVRI